MEYERFKECTFKPQTNPTISQEERHSMYESSVNSQVKGMESFLRKKKYEKKLLEEKKQREREVFDFAGKYDKKKSSRGKRTVPQPFNLSKAPTKFKEKYLKPELKDTKKRFLTREGKKAHEIKQYLEAAELVNA
jgi:hypothetical protein